MTTDDRSLLQVPSAQHAATSRLNTTQASPSPALQAKALTDAIRKLNVLLSYNDGDEGFESAALPNMVLASDVAVCVSGLLAKGEHDKVSDTRASRLVVGLCTSFPSTKRLEELDRVHVTEYAATACGRKRRTTAPRGTQPNRNEPPRPPAGAHMES